MILNCYLKIQYFTLLAIIVSMSFYSASGQISPITVETDKAQYLQKETIYVSGYVDQVIFGQEVSLMVIAPNGNIIYFENLFVDSAKNFQTKLTANSSSMNISGVYTLLVVYGSDNGTAETNFTVVQSPITDLKLKNILLNFDFINSNKKSIQEHVDYKITVLKNNIAVFGPTPLNHSSTGSVSIPLDIAERQPHEVLIEVNGILFSPIPLETASFSIMTNSENVQTGYTNNNSLKINLAVDRDPFLEKKLIPNWIKNNAGWWAEGKIDNETFVQGIQFMIKEKFVNIPNLPYPASWMDKSVPIWVKNNANWWAADLIPEQEFIKGIKYLVEKGVIQI